MTHHLPESEKKNHDEIITSMESKLTKMGLLIKTNPSISKKHGVKRGDITFYPDLYVYEIRGEKNIVIRLYEVETQNTVNDDEAKDQWKKLADGKSDFYLVVPQSLLDKAKDLAGKHKINVKDYLTY
ncbi:MAG: hypothetical protein KKC68_09305 [Candidatus Thermoplasmatota archaeon]|nr:hypothetical protein [Candidatus Thermoplasmatota archaeon]